MRKPCCDKQDTNKGAWSKQEDQKLIDYIRKHGEGCWRTLPQAAGLLRCGKSCRLRWINYLRPDIKRGNFAEDEEDLIIKLHALLGNRWSLIAGRLPGRTDNEVKNYWNSHLRRKLVSMGMDPNNHPLIRNHNMTLFPNPSDRSNSGASSDQRNPNANGHDNKAPVSDAASSLDDGPPSGVPDLNLDLAIPNVHSMNSVSTVDLKGKKQSEYSESSMQTGTQSSPTLLLFR